MNANVIADVDGTRRYGFGILNYPHHGQPGIHTVITADGYHHGVRRDLIELLAEPLPLPQARPTLQLRVTGPYHHDRTWETACNYTRYEIQPGSYPVAWVDINHRPVADRDPAYYGLAVVDAIVVQHHYVNRLLSQSRAHDEYPDTDTTYTLTMYSYGAKPGELRRDGKAQIVQVAPARGEVFPPPSTGRHPHPAGTPCR